MVVVCACGVGCGDALWTLFAGRGDGDRGLPQFMSLHCMLAFAVGGSPPFMLPCCMITFAVGGGWWWVMLRHSVAPLFRLIVVVSAGGSACHQAKVVEWGTLVIVEVLSVPHMF